MDETPNAVLELAESNASVTTCRLAGPLDFSTVPDLLPEIPDLIARSPRLTIDLTGVTRADSAGMALLLEMQRLARGRNCSLSLRHVPASLRNIIHISELDALLPVTD